MKTRWVAVALLLAAASRIAGAEVPGAFARFDWFEYRGEDPIDAIATADARHYRNPILAGFYPDPSIERVGEDYYLVNSSFAYFPGIPLFHSRDLVTWTQIGNVIDRPGQFAFGAIGLSRGIFAPDITYYRGVFYLVSTCIDCGGNFVLTATNPAGPWSDPVWVGIDGIDPALFFDDDGSAWILNNGPPVGTPLYDGHRAIWIQRFDGRALQPVGPRTLLVNGGVDLAAQPIWAEGPHLFRKDGWYYLITAEGGTAEQHAEVVYRSRDVTGPYRPGPGNPILTQRDLDPARPHAITSAGHADFVTTPDGDWWSVFLGARPYRDNHYNIGRETFLLPVKWTDGWPTITRPGSAIPYLAARPDLPMQAATAMPTRGAFVIRDEMDAPALAQQWLRIRTPDAPWHDLAAEPGTLILQARPEPLGGRGQPSYIGRRLQHHWATAQVAVRFEPGSPGDRAGIAIVQNESHFYALTLAGDAAGRVVQLELRGGDDEPPDGVAIASAVIAPAAGQPVELRIEARGDRLDFSYALRPGDWQLLARDVDATVLSTRTAGGFIGATLGPYARGSE